MCNIFIFHDFDIAIAAKQLPCLNARRQLNFSGSLHVLTCLVHAFFNCLRWTKSISTAHQHHRSHTVVDNAVAKRSHRRWPRLSHISQDSSSVLSVPFWIQIINTPFYTVHNIECLVCRCRPNAGHKSLATHVSRTVTLQSNEK